jgi:tyrosine-protein kinase Etk/Wzc
MNMHDLFHLIIKNIKSIIKITVIFSIILFLLLYFVYPVSYRSVVTILPPDNDKELSGLGSLLTGQNFSSLLTGGATNANSQLFIEMLKSRTAAEYVVNKYNLTDYYDAESIEEAAGKLNKDLNVELTKEGIIKLNVEIRTLALPMFFDDIDSVRKFSAAVSNSYVEALDLINRSKLSSKAKRAREYIEYQLISTRSMLDSAEASLMNFQKVNKTISLPEQVQVAIDAAANIKTEIVKTELEIGLLGANLREDNKNLIALKEKLNGLRAQYDKMEIGNQDYLLAFGEVPSLGRQLASLLREVKIQNEVYLLLQQQYYREKIQENRDLPTVEVLDEAIPPLKASGPRVIFSTVMGGIFISLLIILLLVIKEKKILNFRKKYV